MIIDILILMVILAIFFLDRYLKKRNYSVKNRLLIGSGLFVLALVLVTLLAVISFGRSDFSIDGDRYTPHISNKCDVSVSTRLFNTLDIKREEVVIHKCNRSFQHTMDGDDLEYEYSLDIPAYKLKNILNSKPSVELYSLREEIKSYNNTDYVEKTVAGLGTNFDKEIQQLNPISSYYFDLNRNGFRVRIFFSKPIPDVGSSHLLAIVFINR